MIKILESPTGKLNSNLISISAELNQQQKKIEEKQVLRDLPEKEFSFNDFIVVWKQYAFKMKEKGNDSIYYAMSQRDPVIIDKNRIQLMVENHALFEMLQSESTDLHEFVREKLNNWSIQIQIKQEESNDQQVKYLTGKDKFEKLARKNPNLYSFLKTFNLEIEL